MIKKDGWVELDIDKLVAADWNYKKEDFEQSKKLAENIKRNGQVENILVRELATGFFEVVNGNHRLTTFTELGFKEVVCYNFGKISDAQARRIAIETNETRFETDNIKLAQLIKEISGDEGFKLEDLETTMPYTQQQLEAMEDLVNFDWAKFQDEVNKGEDPDPEDPDAEGDDDTIVCPHCGGEIELE